MPSPWVKALCEAQVGHGLPAAVRGQCARLDGGGGG